MTFLISGSAHAAVVSGTAEDPRGDVPNIVEEYHPRDLRSFGLRYDDERGILRATITHWDPQAHESGAEGYHWFEASADVGVTRADGSCDVASTGSVRTRMIAPNDGYGFGSEEPGIWAAGTVVNHAPTVYGDVAGSPSSNRWTYTLTSPAFVRRGYNCVANVAVLHYGSTTADRGGSFCMGPSGTTQCVGRPEPISIRWTRPREGQTVSGFLHEGRATCWAESRGPIVRTENWVDGRLNDRQVDYPWGCEWDTRRFANGRHTLTVKAFASDGRMVEHSVRVNVFNARPIVDDLQRPVTDVVGSGLVGPIEPGFGNAPAGQASGTGQVAGLTVVQARRAAQRALVREYGRRYPKRARRGDKLTCRRVTRTRASCRVVWRYNPSRYSGPVRVTRTADEIFVSPRIRIRSR